MLQEIETDQTRFFLPRHRFLPCFSLSVCFSSTLRPPCPLITTRRYILKHFDVEDTSAFSSYVAAAISRGADNGTFELPKGLGGKVKLAGDKEVRSIICPSSLASLRYTRAETDESSKKQNEAPPKKTTARTKKTVIGDKKPAAPKRGAPTLRKAPGTRKVCLLSLVHLPDLPPSTFCIFPVPFAHSYGSQIPSRAASNPKKVAAAKAAPAPAKKVRSRFFRFVFNFRVRPY